MKKYYILILFIFTIFTSFNFSKATETIPDQVTYCQNMIIGSEVGYGGKCVCPSGKQAIPYQNSYVKLICVSSEEYKRYEDNYVNEQVNKIKSERRTTAINEAINDFLNRRPEYANLINREKLIELISSNQGKYGDMTMTQIVESVYGKITSNTNNSQDNSLPDNIDFDKLRMAINDMIDSFLKDNPSYQTIIDRTKITNLIVNNPRKYQNYNMSQIVKEVYGDNKNIKTNISQSIVKSVEKRTILNKNIESEKNSENLNKNTESNINQVNNDQQINNNQTNTKAVGFFGKIKSWFKRLFK